MAARKLTPEEKLASHKRRMELQRIRYHRDKLANKPRKVYTKCPSDFRQSKYRHKSVRPIWANLKYMEMFYVMANEYRQDGINAEVDHMVPINNPLVCGLHNEYNLQIVTANYNKLKKERYWPEMPEYPFKDYEELYAYYSR